MSNQNQTPSFFSNLFASILWHISDTKTSMIEFIQLLSPKNVHRSIIDGYTFLNNDGPKGHADFTFWVSLFIVGITISVSMYINSFAPLICIPVYVVGLICAYFWEKRVSFKKYTENTNS